LKFDISEKMILLCLNYHTLLDSDHADQTVFARKIRQSRPSPRLTAADGANQENFKNNFWITTVACRRADEDTSAAHSEQRLCAATFAAKSTAARVARIRAAAPLRSELHAARDAPPVDLTAARFSA
jgi:hypothetical protein